MDWQAATAEAGRIAQAWTTEAGPGGAVLLFDADDIRAEACGGLASLESERPFLADTVVRYASISKHVLAALLVRDGILGLDEFLGVHLKLPPALGAVTVGRALDMTGGLPDVTQTLELIGVPASTTLDHHALLAFVQRLDALNFRPGAEIAYSNTGYRLAQAALEARGIDLAGTLHDRFWRPLGLGIRMPYDAAEPVAGLAGGYRHTANGWRRGRYGLHFSASGALAGNARDLAIWLQALLTDRAPAHGLLPHLAHLRKLSDGRPTAYGLGLARHALGRRVLVGHGGALPGFRTQFLLDPEARAGVVVVSNREDTDAATLALRVLAALHRVAAPEPARGALPEGLYAMPGTPFWLTQEGGRLVWLGAEDVLYRDEGNDVVGRTAFIAARLRQADGAIEGEIGHVARRFVPVPAGLEADPAWEDAWTCPAHNARIEVHVRDGAATLTAGAGALRAVLPLQPLGEGRALAERGGEGAAGQRFCMQFGRDEVRLVGSRSRVVRFRRG